ncbi:hypothetical protein KEM52_001153 [Ascosphaera acerosa]|nr:hypothetical protein KEM52_001153 [Ascosphaera acerosa]
MQPLSVVFGDAEWGRRALKVFEVKTGAEKRALELYRVKASQQPLAIVGHGQTSLEPVKPSPATEALKPFVGPGESLYAIDFNDDTHALTCPVGLCPLRFVTLADMKEHRALHLSHARQDDPSSQEHLPVRYWCTRFNKKTGRYCCASFRRPYDLSRHEFSIHSRYCRQECPDCHMQQDFSRADAVFRHQRSFHPETLAAPSVKHAGADELGDAEPAADAGKRKRPSHSHGHNRPRQPPAKRSRTADDAMPGPAVAHSGGGSEADAEAERDSWASATPALTRTSSSPLASDASISVTA